MKEQSEAINGTRLEKAIESYNQRSSTWDFLLFHLSDSSVCFAMKLPLFSQ
jgi:hypothetical protein